jgi:hypothetical protein
MMKFGLVASAALIAGLVAGGAPANAFTVIGTETSTSGFVGSLFPGGSPYTVASDGEAPFDPFGAGFDTSDGLNFSAVGFVWNQAAGSIWTPLGNQTWVLPADLTGIGCGAENETHCEPVGHFISPAGWTAGSIGTWVIADWAGDTDFVGRPGWSDVITTWNDANGNANLTFASDSIPEASTWAMLLVGFAGLGFAGYRAKAKLALPAI